MLCLPGDLYPVYVWLWQGTAAGSWSLGIVEQSQGEETVDCGETDREEIVVGNACAGKPGSRGSKVTLLSHV